MISSITINHFRGIDNLTVENFGKINVFVGKNNSGKTTLLEALFLIAGIGNPDLARIINDLRDYHKIDKTGVSLFFNDLIIDKEILIKANLKHPIEERFLTITPATTSNIISGNRIDTARFGGNSLPQRHEIGLKYSIIINRENLEQPINLTLHLLPQGEQVAVELPTDYTEHLSARLFTNVTLFNNLDKFIQTIIIEKSIDRVVNILRQIDSRITSIELGTDGLILCDIGLPTLVPINILGDGLIKVISTLAAIAAMKNGILLIDEIENGLHYSTLKIIWTAIAEAAIFYNVQIFATTHSYECLNALQKSIDEFNVYRIEKHDNATRTVQFDAEELAGMIEHGWEVR